MVLTSTSAGLLLPLLKDAGLHRAPFGQLVMAGAALAEVVPVMMLSLLFSATSSTSAGRVSSLVALLAVLAAIGLALGRVRNLAALDRLLDRLEDHSAQLRLRAALTLTLAFAVLAERFGFASILGAFAAGLLVRTIDLTGRTPHPQFQVKLEGIGFGFLIPVFFIATGVQFDVRALVSNPAALAEVPLFLLALLVVRGRSRAGLRAPDRQATGQLGRPDAGRHPHLRDRGQPDRYRVRADQPDHRRRPARGRPAVGRALPRPGRQAAASRTGRTGSRS